MEQQLIDENAQLKEIIRENDRRIYYLESKIKNMVNDCDIETCFECHNSCDYDEEKCDCNMFCTNYLCRNCINKSKLKCQYSKCKKWFCEKYPPAVNCLECSRIFCNDHFLEMKSVQKSRPIDLCQDCYPEKEYDYCDTETLGSNL